MTSRINHKNTSCSPHRTCATSSRGGLDEDGAEVVDIRARRAGDDQVVERGKDAVAVVVGEGAPRVLAVVLAACGWGLALALGLLALAAGAQAAGLPLLAAVADLFDGRTADDVRHIADGVTGSPQLALWVGLGAVAALGLAVGAGLRRWALALASMFACTAAVAVGVQTVAQPAIGTAYTRLPFAAALRRAAGDPAGVHTGGLDYGTLFYWGSAMPAFDADTGLEPPPYLLLPEPEWLQMSPAERRRFRRVPGLTIERGNNQGYVVVVEPNAAAEDAD